MVVETKKVLSLTSEPIFLKEISGDTFFANYVIHAYEQGKRRGRYEKIAELESDAKTQFSKHRDYTIEIINNLVTELITDGIMIQRGWIKSAGINDFDAIIAIPQDDYFSESFEKFYIRVNEIEQIANNQNLHLNIGYINNDKQINEEKLYCDGYELEFSIKVSPKTLVN